MPNCTSCGSPIPEGQGESCSMCYGDPYYGRDGYMLEAMEADFQRQQDREQAEQQQREAQDDPE